MDKRHCPSYANRSAVRVLGAASGPFQGAVAGDMGGTWLISTLERPME